MLKTAVRLPLRSTCVTARVAGFAHVKSYGLESWRFGVKILAGMLLVGIDVTSPAPTLANSFAAVPCEIVQVAAGPSQTLALAGDGRVWAWGSPPGFRPTPAPVAALSGAVAVAAGGDLPWSAHSLVLLADGTIRGWGTNASGQLGDGTTTDSPLPVAVVGLTAADRISAGGYHSLARRGDGTVWAWGGNAAGQLGNGTSVDSSTPVAVTGLVAPREVAAGDSHSLALLADGTVWAWGANSSGQLGNGTNTASSVPVPVIGLTGVTAIGAGDSHSIALTTDGTVWAWGANGSSQLGNGAGGGYRNLPGSVLGLASIVSIAAGSHHCLALDASGQVWGWGWNEFAQLGDGSFTNSSLAVTVASVTAASVISAGHFQSLAVVAGGTLLGWGETNMLGTGTGSTYLEQPQLVPGVLDVVSLGSGRRHTLAVLRDGSVRSWGENDTGQLGHGSAAWRSTVPGVVIGLAQIVDVDGGDYHSLAARADGTVWAWGRNFDGALGDGTNLGSPIPVQTVGIADAMRVAAGYGHSLALRADRTLAAWGLNTYGQLGNGSLANSNVPVPVSGLIDVVAVAGGHDHALAATADGSVWAWGRNQYGQLGDGTLIDALVPVRVNGIGRPVDAVAAGDGHSLAVARDGTVWAWGWGIVGQLGDGNTVDSAVPVQVLNLSLATGAAAGRWHSLAVQNGTAWGWGNNNYGELGDPAVSLARSPFALLNDVTSLTSSDSHVHALRTDGTVWSWGFNEWGQGGVGTSGQTIRPVPAGPDAPAPEQGNLLRAFKRGGDVSLAFRRASAAAFQIYRDADKSSLGMTPHGPSLTTTSWLDPGAVADAADHYYHLRGLSACSGLPGP